jgi:excisionase family DNA binding protein
MPIKPASPLPPSTALEPVSLSPETAARLSGVSVRSIYRLLERKAITARRCGARTLIDYQSLQAYFKSLPEYVPGASMPNAPHVAGKRRTRRAGKAVRS